MTKIQWTEETWNPVTGCTQIAAGCKHCYAKEMHRRLRAMGQPKYQHDFSEVRCHPEELEKPLKWRKPRRVFVNSMSDLFIEGVPSSFIDKVLSIMALTPQHTYQVLTKRPARANEYFENHKSLEAALEGEANAEWLHGFLGWDKFHEVVNQVSDYFRSLANARPNLWLGVSASTQNDLDDLVPNLLRTPSVVHFLSLEPLVEHVNIVEYLDSIEWHTSDEPMDAWLDWVIVGSESGPHRRPCKIEWIESIVEQCQAANVPVFVKQAEIDGKLVKMPKILGKVWDQYPEVSHD